MPIQVIGAGLGRTGTLSLKAALEELGFAKCYHMVEVLARADDAGPGMPPCAASRSTGTGSSPATGRPSTVPGCLFYRELLEKYPEAKVILTVRDPERWYDSAHQTIYFVRARVPEPGSPPQLPGCASSGG